MAIPAELAATTWPVRMADDAVRAPFEGNAGWSHLFRRSLPDALAAFAADPGDGRGLARVHMEYAAIYRQAALLGANATLGVYGVDRQDVDPVEVDYLLAASAGLTGDCEAVATALAAWPPPAGSPSAAGHAAWSAWASATPCPAPLSLGDASAFSGAPASLQPGETPNVGDLPHFAFAEQTEEAREVRAADPTSLYALSVAHERAALTIAPEADRAILGALLSPWALPIDPPASAPPAELDDAWLFAGFLLAPSDAPFLVALRADGLAAVDAHKATSPLAASVAPAIVDGKVVPDRMLDQAAWLGQQLQAEMVVRGGGEQPFHRGFADVARVAALRAGMLAADAGGQHRDAGILRINALERSTGPVADPVFFMSVAAWDAGNRNPLRAQDIVHSLITRFPAVEAARYPLDAMHIRLSRNAAPATPVH